MNDIILNYLEEHDCKFVLSFVADGEVVSQVEATDLDEVLVQSHKLEGADIDWANEELTYSEQDQADRYAKEPV